MSVYGYPREPEGTGDETAPPDLPYRVSSQPVSVPSNPPPGPPDQFLPPESYLPPPAPPESYLSPPESYLPPSAAPESYLPPSAAPESYLPPSAAPESYLPPSAAPESYLPPSAAPESYLPPPAPPAPLLPPVPPGAPYAAVADLIPTQRARESEAAPVPGSPGPDGPESRSGRHRGFGDVDDAGGSGGFGWLRPADHAPAPTDPLGFGPSPDPGQPPVAPPTPPTPPPGFGPSPSMGQPPVDRPGFGPSPSMGQPPVDRPGFGPSPSMGQPPVPVPEVDRPGFGRSPATGQAAVASAAAGTYGHILEDGPAVAPETATAPTIGHVGPTEAGTGAIQSTTAPAPAWSVPLPPLADDEPEIAPWDRTPLLVVIAAVAVLVLIGIVSGVVAAAIASTPVASWRVPGSASTPDPAAPSGVEPSAAPPAAGETITLSSVGDVIMGSANLGVPPNNGAGFFDPVRDALAADLVMGNLDMALSDPTGFGKCSPGATDCFQLSLPPSYANVLRDGGFHLMSLANNHTFDEGQQGYANTRAALDGATIDYTGGVDEIAYVTVKNLNVAVIGFSVYSYTANLNDIPRAAELVRQAATQADLVVVQMQGGAEGSDRTRVPPAGQHESFGGEDRGDLRGFAHAVIDAGADVVFGHGPHVMRGMEFYQGRLVAYSLGNFCGYAVLSSSGWSGVGGVLKVTLQRDGTWVQGQLVATELVDRGMPAVDAELRALAFVDDLSVQDFGATAARIDHATGAIAAP